jgi:diaminopimelate epimerase
LLLRRLQVRHAGTVTRELEPGVPAAIMIVPASKAMLLRVFERGAASWNITAGSGLASSPMTKRAGWVSISTSSGVGPDLSKRRKASS